MIDGCTRRPPPVKHAKRPKPPTRAPYPKATTSATHPGTVSILLGFEGGRVVELDATILDGVVTARAKTEPV